MQQEEVYARHALCALMKQTKTSLEALLKHPCLDTQRDVEAQASDILVRCSIETLRIYSARNPGTSVDEIYRLATRIFCTHEKLPMLYRDAELMQSLAG